MTLDLLLDAARPGDLFALLALRGTVVFGVASLLALLLRTRSSAEVARAVWATAFVGFALVSFGTLLLGPSAPGPTVSIPLGSMASMALGDGGMPPTPVPATVVWFWLAGVAAVVAHTLLGVAVRAWLSRESRLVATPEWLARSASRIASGQGMRRDVTVRVGAGLRTPVTWGVWRPVVFLPVATLQMGQARIDQILAHELEHIRRLDAGLLWFVGLARALLWFHPLVAWAARDLRRSQEEACDEAAVRVSESPLSYARLLLEYAAQLPPTGFQPHGATFLGRGTLEHRVRRVLSGESGRGPGRSVGGRLAVCAVAAVCALLLTVGAAWSVSVDPGQRTFAPPTEGLGAILELAPGSGLDSER